MRKLMFLAILAFFTISYSQTTTIALFGDPQSITYDNLKPAVENIYRFTASLNPDVVLVAGDLNEHGENLAYDDTLLAIVKRTGIYSEPNTRFFPVAGGHDLNLGFTGSPDSATWWAATKLRWQDKFDLPGNEVYYSFVKNNIYFINCYMDYGDPVSIRQGNFQYRWLVNELTKANANPAIDWIFLNFHYPPMEIGSGTSGASFDMPYLCKLINDYNVDVVLNGHQHVYHRTYPVTFRASGSEQVPVVTTAGKGTTFLCASRSELPLMTGAPLPYHAIAVGSNNLGTKGCLREAIIKIVINGKIGHGNGQNTLLGQRTVFDTFTVLPRPKTHSALDRRPDQARVSPALTVFPNPASASVTIQWTGLRRAGGIIEILDVAGSVVRRFETGESLRWDTRGVNTRPGPYFVRLKSGGRVFTEKMMVLR